MMTTSFLDRLVLQFVVVLHYLLLLLVRTLSRRRKKNHPSKKKNAPAAAATAAVTAGKGGGGGGGGFSCGYQFRISPPIYQRRRYHIFCGILFGQYNIERRFFF